MDWQKSTRRTRREAGSTWSVAGSTIGLFNVDAPRGKKLSVSFFPAAAKSAFINQAVIRLCPLLSARWVLRSVTSTPERPKLQQSGRPRVNRARRIG